MFIDFEIDGKPVQYHRDAFTGQSELRTEEGTVTMDRAAELGTHFSLETKTSKTVDVYGHKVTVEKVRPQWFGGLRPANYRVLVDGELLLERNGY